jgi:outer membrane protein
LLIALAALACAQTVAAADLKIVVVDVNAAIGQTQEAQQFLGRVQEELKADQDRIRELTADKTRIEERVERDGEVMSNEERVKLSEEYERITSDLQYRAETYQKDINRKRNELFRQMGPRVEAALDDLVKREGYDIVLPRNSVIYVNPRQDITRKLTERLDAKS